MPSNTSASPNTPHSTPDGRPLKPGHQDSVLESLGKAITDPIREASEDESTDVDSGKAEPEDRAARHGH